MHEHGIEPIDLLVVNLYPFESITQAPDCSYEEAIENIDIGGPAMLRAAAKNQDHVTAVVDPGDYAELIQTLAERQGTSWSLRRRLAAKAFAHTARYDGLIANWLGTHADSDHVEQFPPQLNLTYTRRAQLRYGENPHQGAALYLEAHPPAGTVATSRVLAGKELSYNNIADADAALECVKAFHKTPACVIVKHANPCGVALGASAAEAYEHAYATDPLSAFGGIIAFNQPLDAAYCRRDPRAPVRRSRDRARVDNAALALFSKKPNVRVLAFGTFADQPETVLDFKRIAGGLLVQEADRDTLMMTDLKVVSKRVPDAGELHDLLFAWHVAMFVKSNCDRLRAPGPHDRHRRRPDEPRHQREDCEPQGARSQTRGERQL
jgi:phosphoribosylaminoimidazolecarboxamide formyltransferase/IMP cyclohydrolase